MFTIGILINTYWKFLGEAYPFRSTLNESMFTEESGDTLKHWLAATVFCEYKAHSLIFLWF